LVPCPIWRGIPEVFSSTCCYLSLGSAQGWYAFCFPLDVHLETLTKKLARTVLVISACSLAVVVLGAKLTARQNISVRHTADSPIYTYQNPFNRPDVVSSVTSAGTGVASHFSRLLSFKCLAGLSSLGTLWLGASCYLYGGQRKRKRVHRAIEFAAKNQVKMNPLATVPAKPVTFVGKEDTVRITVLPRPMTRNRFVHRQVTAPCQSRFRPTALGLNQTRFGRLK
jgi:hypothetical protein